MDAGSLTAPVDIQAKPEAMSSSNKVNVNSDFDFGSRFLREIR
jgi:hypothetical protein